LLIGALAVAVAPAAAQGKGIGKPAGVGKPTTRVVKGASGTVTKGKSADAKGRTLVKGKSADAKGGTLAKGNSADHAKGPKTTTSDATVAGTDTDAALAGGSGRGHLTTAERIAMNPQQKARIEAALAGTGLTLEQAAEGFRNQGQFIAAVNAAKNENLSFVDLKAKMTGDNPMSLGQALQALGVSDTDAASSEAPATETTTTP
jgi:hypothetical protein